MTQTRIKSLTDSRAFHAVSISLILANAALMGLEATPAAMARGAGTIQAALGALQALFVAELALRLWSFSPAWWRYFRDGWNVFDFLVISLSMIPAVGPVAGIARAVRLLRVLRLISGIGELRLIVAAMLRSLSSLGNVLILMALVLYIYAVLGVHLFSRVNADAWGGVGQAALTLFQILTLEGWIDLQNEAMKVHPWAWLYFVSFVVVGGFVVINLFVAVVVSNFDSVRAEFDRPQADPGPEGTSDLAARLARLSAQLEEIERLVRGKPPAAPGGVLAAQARRLPSAPSTP